MGFSCQKGKRKNGQNPFLQQIKKVVKSGALFAQQHRHERKVVAGRQAVLHAANAPLKSRKAAFAVQVPLHHQLDALLLKQLHKARRLLPFVEGGVVDHGDDPAAELLSRF